MRDLAYLHLSPSKSKTFVGRSVSCDIIKCLSVYLSLCFANDFTFKLEARHHQSARRDQRERGLCHALSGALAAP